MTLSVALVQTALAWEDPQANRTHLDGVLRAVAPGTDLIVLPEMFTSGFTMEPRNIPSHEAEKSLDWMARWARKTNAAIAGSLVWPEGDRFYNRFLLVEPDGTCHTYDKRHTFTLAGEDKVYTRGNRQVIVPFRGLRFCLQICYDLRFPVWSRNTQDYDALLYVANWPVARISAWDTLLKARAIENMAYVVGVNRVGTDPKLEYSGHSAVYDPLGASLAYLEGEPGILYAELSKTHLEDTRRQLRFLQDRDRFTPGW